MKYFHPEDNKLFFHHPSQPLMNQNKYHLHSIEECTIEGLIDALQQAKVNQYTEVQYLEDCIMLLKEKTPEELEAERTGYSVRLAKWQAEYDSKKAILEEAYKKKQELDAIMQGIK